MGQWVSSSVNSSVPDNAVRGGFDNDGTPIYVGRCSYKGNQLPVKVIPSKRAASISLNGKVHKITKYELLVGNSFAWAPCDNGRIPSKAVTTGNTRDGEPLYIGRGFHANSLIVGKVHPSHGCLYVPYGGNEIRLSSYEVLFKT
ncbi:uncharacterized protein LOC111519609 [Drosophila willistoni]|uniref:uncharacterized protein LOC111519609 n=1 Tax=Drosophila willistoni TaxID=7260 RepID=UPI00017D9B75|nr:uncharacterized protein LOC111519609 [Drosophila willistoni]